MWQVSQRWTKAEGVIAFVALVTQQQLVVIAGRHTDLAQLAKRALPRISAYLDRGMYWQI